MDSVSVYRRSPLTVIRGHLAVGWREVYAMVRADGKTVHLQLDRRAGRGNNEGHVAYKVLDNTELHINH